MANEFWQGAARGFRTGALIGERGAERARRRKAEEDAKRLALEREKTLARLAGVPRDSEFFKEIEGGNLSAQNAIALHRDRTAKEAAEQEAQRAEKETERVEFRKKEKAGTEAGARIARASALLRDPTFAKLGRDDPRRQSISEQMIRGSIPQRAAGAKTLTDIGKPPKPEKEEKPKQFPTDAQLQQTLNAVRNETVEVPQVNPQFPDLAPAMVKQPAFPTPEAQIAEAVRRVSQSQEFRSQVIGDFTEQTNALKIQNDAKEQQVTELRDRLEQIAQKVGL